jgi:hypothetical protein
MPALLCAGAFVAGTTGWTDMEPEPEPDQDFC